MPTSFPEVAAGGFSRADGTVAFWTRVSALATESSVVLDFGAGRGVASEDPIDFRRDLQILRGRVHRVIGCDVDAVVLDNPLLDEAAVVTGQSIPVSSQSIDLVVANSVFEHVEEPRWVADELDRVLRPGGWICARTPNRHGYIAMGARLVPNRAHISALRHLQPRRQAQDVFPTAYRMNTKGALRRMFPLDRFSHHTFGWNGDPSYFGASPKVRWLVWRTQQFAPESLAPMLLIFIRKHPSS